MKTSGTNETARAAFSSSAVLGRIACESEMECAALWDRGIMAVALPSARQGQMPVCPPVNLQAQSPRQQYERNLVREDP